MALLADNGIISGFRHVTDWMANAAESLLGARPRMPGEPVETMAMLDPLLRPRVAMSHEGLDLNTLVELGKQGYRNGKLVTAKTHPELFKAWGIESARAGLSRAPQLIIVESRTPNAAAVSPHEVILTTGLLKIMNFRDVVSILGHELGHEKNDHVSPRILAKAAFAIPGAFVGDHLLERFLTPKSEILGKAPNMLERMRLYLASGQGALSRLSAQLMAIYLGASAGSIIANQISVKPTELQADIDGAAISGDPVGAAMALRKLGETEKKHSGFKRALSYLMSGYPTIDQRVDNLTKIAATMPSDPVVEKVAPGTVPGMKVSQRMAPARLQEAPEQELATHS